MILELPTLNDATPFYTFRTKLEGADYQFTFRFDERREAWMFDLDTLDGVAIIHGQMVTCGRDLLGRVAKKERPPGILWAMNLFEPAEGGRLARPGLLDLGPQGRCRLYYTESTTAAENAQAQ